MGFGFTDLTPEGKKYFRELKKMTDMEIQVGFQGDQKYEDGTSIAQVAAVNEFGASDIPERPFMRQSFENHEGELQAACDAAQRLVSSGGSAEQALQQIGVVAKGLVQDEIVNGGFAPNAESTIKKKGSEQPLIDTGTMRQSVNFVVKRRGG
jgi:hypothetical protein